MAKLAFVKYSALGNDFILFEKNPFLQSIEEDPSDLPQWIQSLCHRRRGIGADGVVLYERRNEDHFAIDFYNSDGSFAALCGNGLRAAAHYIGLIYSLQSVLIQTARFLHHCTIDSGIDPDLVTCTMQTPSYHGIYSLSDPFHKNSEWHLLECGVPHLIKVLSQFSRIHAVPLAELGATFQHRSELPFDTVNVSILEPQDNLSQVYIRTYERGVFQETEACGTAAMSAAALLHRQNPSFANWAFHFVGFNSNLQESEILEVELRETCKMKGEVKLVFEGTLSSEFLIPHSFS